MSAMHLYNTASRRLEPLSGGERLGYYCCGPTVYGPTHIGNFRTFLLQDVLRRVLELEGLKPLHVRNITDVDDKTIRESIKAQMSLEAFTQKWTQRFHEDCGKLGLLAPHEEPKATEHIEEQIQLIERLLQKGLAYTTPKGSVYFRVEAFDDYGKLNGLERDALQTQATNSAQERNLADEYERDCIADFALWKAHKEQDGPVGWESPWGRGRPGWHIECSVMSMRYLGTTLDLHAGGVDLCFPHHENEIAQSEGATGKPFCKNWFHTAHLQVEGQKMSKSLGNLYTLTDLEAQGYSPLAVRYTLISGHYRQPLNFTLPSLDAAQSALNKLSSALGKALKAAQWTQADWQALQPEPAHWGLFEPVQLALHEDLNTPKALGALFTSLKHAPEADAQAARAVLKNLKTVCYALGLELNPQPQATQAEIPQTIQALAQRRWEAKKARDFTQADALRKELFNAGWDIQDTPEGFTLSQRS